MPFPTWVYHAEHAAKVVQSDIAEKLCEGEWEDSPAKCKTKPKAETKPKAVRVKK